MQALRGRHLYANEVRAPQEPRNAVDAELAISNQSPPSLHEVPANSTRAGAVPPALRGVPPRGWQTGPCPANCARDSPGATQPHRMWEPHQQTRRMGSEAGEATRTAGTGNHNIGDGRLCAWGAATIQGMGWRASPIATGCQGNLPLPNQGVPDRSTACTTNHPKNAEARIHQRQGDIVHGNHERNHC